ncbi:MAG: dihydroorotate dehydrogenase [candidate division Zixibacteria bacterium]|nr:dihydroorotate dehydrogenase [candidate division Zixibacteria bacterium]
MGPKKTKAPDLHVTIAGVEFATPIWTASGTAGTGEEIERHTDPSKLGALVTKSVSLEPRPGHPYPRTCETASGMLNCIGLQNKGIDAFIAEELPRLQRMKTRAVVNIVGNSIDDYVELAKRLDGQDGVDLLELNLSCPNVEKGIDQGSDPSWIGECVAGVRTVTKTPLVVKLTPNTNNIAALAVAAEQAGADAISAINTLVGMAVHHWKLSPRLSNVTGGLSGPAIKPVALAAVYKIVRAVEIPVIGIGGIANGLDAAEFLIVGASAVQVGTAIFRSPKAPIDIAQQLSDYLAQMEVESVSNLVGRLEA